MSEAFRPTRLEISQGALAGNVRLLRAQTPMTAKLMAVVKADAYGHGAIQAARVALLNGADMLAVAIPEEGAQLREAGIEAPVLVLGGIAEAGAVAAVEYRLTQTVFDVATVRHLSEVAVQKRTVVNVHIKIDTGMGRIGVRDEEELRRVAEAALTSPNLWMSGVYTHFASADDEDLSFTRLQAERFDKLVAFLRGMRPDIIAHACNSAGLLRCPEYAYDMVRAGLSLYLDPCLPGGAGEGLKDVMRWVTQAVHVKEISPGDSVSYGRRFIAARPTRVMTLPVGYADGYHRAIGGRGRALVRGQSAPVIGRVCMDQCMLDVTEIPGADVGDEVVLLGAQGNERITAREMGEWCGMIDYEIVLSPTSRVPKVYTE